MQERKTKFLIIRLTEKEKKIIERRADRAGKKLTELVRGYLKL